MLSTLRIEVFVIIILCFQGKVVLLHPSDIVNMQSENRENDFT